MVIPRPPRRLHRPSPRYPLRILLLSLRNPGSMNEPLPNIFKDFTAEFVNGSDQNRIWNPWSLRRGLGINTSNGFRKSKPRKHGSGGSRRDEKKKPISILFEPGLLGYEGLWKSGPGPSIFQDLRGDQFLLQSPSRFAKNGMVRKVPVESFPAWILWQECPRK